MGGNPLAVLPPPDTAPPSSDSSPLVKPLRGAPDYTPHAQAEPELSGTADICLVSAADIWFVSTADISISIHHSASAFSINNQHIMEAATAADFWLP